MFSHQAHKRKFIEASYTSWKEIAAYFDISSQKIIIEVGNNKSSLEFYERVIQILEQKKVTLSQLADALTEANLEHLIQPKFGFFQNDSSEKRQKTLCTDSTDMKQKSPIYLIALAGHLKKFDNYFIEKQPHSNSNIYDHLKELSDNRPTFCLSDVIKYLQTFESVGVIIDDDWCSFETLKKTKPPLGMIAPLCEFSRDNKLFPLWKKLINDTTNYDNSPILQKESKMSLDQLFHHQLYDILTKSKVKNLETLVNTFEEMIKLRKTTRLVGELSTLCLVHFSNLICLYQSQYELDPTPDHFIDVYRFLVNIVSSQPNIFDTDLIRILETTFDIKQPWFENYSQHAITKTDIDRYQSLFFDNLGKHWQSLLKLWEPTDFKFLFKLQSLKTDHDRIRELFYSVMVKRFTISKIDQDIASCVGNSDESTMKMSEI